MSRLRPVLSVPVLVLATLVFGTVAIALGLLFGRRDLAAPMVPLWSRTVLGAAGVRVRVRGSRGPASPSSPVFVANHRSNLDIAVLGALLPTGTLWLAKRELFSIPVFGRAIRSLGCISVDRANSEAARESIGAAADELRGGAPIVIFPEGTRSRTGEMLPFKPGFVYLASAARAPVVPVVIQGTARLWPPGGLAPRPGQVSVTFLDPIWMGGEEAGKAPRDRAEEVRQLMTRVAGE